MVPNCGSLHHKHPSLKIQLKSCCDRAVTRSICTLGIFPCVRVGFGPAQSQVGRCGAAGRAARQAPAPLDIAARFGQLKSSSQRTRQVLREHYNGMYSMPAWYGAKVVADLPFEALFPCVLGSVVYWLTGLNHFAKDHAVDNWLWVCLVVMAIAQVCAGGIRI